MPGLSFLNKKSWHTTNVKNVERVWLAEKKAEEEQKRLAELQKQLQEERQILELRQLQAAQGQVTKTIDNSLDWMYEGPVSSNQKQQSSEEYLLGKIYNAAADHSKVEVIPDAKAPAKWLNKVASKNDSFSRAHEDPFVMIKQEENRRREKVVNNPIKMDKIKQKIASELQEKDDKKRQKKLAKREKKEQKKEAKRRRKEGRREDQTEKDGSSSSSGSDSEGSDREGVKKEPSARGAAADNTNDSQRRRSRSPSPARGARSDTRSLGVDRSEYHSRDTNRDTRENRDDNRDSRFDRSDGNRGSRDRERERASRRDSRDRTDRRNNTRERRDSRDRNDRDDRDQRATDRFRDDRRDDSIRDRDQRDSRWDSRDRRDRRSNSRSREPRDRRDFDRNNDRSHDAYSNRPSNAHSHADTRKRERSPSPAAPPAAADRTRTSRHTMQSDSDESDGSGPRKPKQQYGLLPNKNRRPDLTSSGGASGSTSSNASLGPNPALLQKKLDAEKAAEAERRNRARGDVRGLSEEERQRRILAMQEDAQTNDIVRSTRHEPQPATAAETEENTGNAAFLESMRKTVYTTNDIDMQSRIDQNKYNRQSSAEIDSADGFLRK